MQDIYGHHAIILYLLEDAHLDHFCQLSQGGLDRYCQHLQNEIFVLQILVFSIQIFLLKSLKFYVTTFNFLKLMMKGYISCCENQKKVKKR